MSKESENSTRRRPEWRGERRAILVRLPIDVADQLAARVNLCGGTLSGVAAELIADGLHVGHDTTAARVAS